MIQWRQLVVILILLFNFKSLSADGHAGHQRELTTLAPVVVTAERVQAYSEENPHQVVMLDDTDIEQRNLLSVEEALGTLAGVEVIPGTGMGSRISIRGSGKSGGVLVLLNGRPLSGNHYGGVDLSSISIDSVKSITVFKPPVPAWLGPGASQGAVCIVTKDVIHHAPQEKRPKIKVRGAGGGYGKAEGTVSCRKESDNGSFMISVSGSRGDGKRQNSDRESGYGTISWDRRSRSGGQLHVDGRVYRAQYGSAGPLDNLTPDARQTYEKAALNTRLKGPLGSLGDYVLNVYGAYIDLEDKSQTGRKSTLTTLKTGIKGDYTWIAPNETWTVRSSTIVERDDLDHTITGDHDRITAGLGVQTDGKFKKLVLTIGARGDHVTDFSFNPGGGLGLSYGISDQLRVKVNTGVTKNIPSFGQLYQPSHGSIDQVKGNPDLFEETVWSGDITLAYQKDDSRLFQASLFHVRTDDPIYYDRIDGLLYQPVNGEKATRYGAEVTCKITLETNTTVDASAIFQDSELHDTGEALAYTPDTTLKLAIFRTFPSWGTRLETSAKYKSRQYAYGASDTVYTLDDYVTVDVKGIQPFKLYWCTGDFFLSVTNLFDERYQVHYGYPDDGICFTAGVTLSF